MLLLSEFEIISVLRSLFNIGKKKTVLFKYGVKDYRVFFLGGEIRLFNLENGYCLVAVRLLTYKTAFDYNDQSIIKIRVT